VVARWFRISFAENAFRRHLAQAGIDLTGLRVPSAVSAAIAFYREARAQHAAIAQEGDGLFWRWGPNADASRFIVDLTRQLVREGDDAPIVQLTLCLAFRWTPARHEVGRGHLHTFDPDSIADFERSIRRSTAYRAVAGATPIEAELRTDTL
jgi:hypothetical protein